VRLKGVLKFLVFGATSAALMGVVFNSNANRNLFKPVYDVSGKAALPPLAIDTPEVDLPYKFEDNKGNEPIYDDKHKLYLENPSNVKTDIKYDPSTGNYDVTQKMGKLNYRPDTYIEAQDYQDYMFKKSTHDYWKTKIAADDMNKPRKGIVPKLQVNSELFDRIFGGNTVDIRPTGTAELIFGLNRNKTLNPAIPQKQQKVTNFDFNMRIQLNLIGKIGDKLKITTSYNTEASFDWENQVKLDYTGYEDEIIKKIEAGNVSLPLNSSLITGSQSLFGIKTQLQFGRLTMTTILSQQRGKKQEVNIQGGAQTQQFSVNGDNYEANKHFFLSHYFRDNYNTWMGTLPVVSTPIVITKIEVYLLNQTGNTDQTRNIIAFEDLGEDSSNVHPNFLPSSGCVSNPFYQIHDSADIIPHNGANSLYSIISNTTTGLLKDRQISQASSILTSATTYSNACTGSGQYMIQSRDFDLIGNARKLNTSEYTLNNRLGFISLNQSLNNDQALAVTFQFTYNGKTYQVGEFSDQLTDNTKAIFAKLLKGVNVNVKYPSWDLMMKNVYSLGAYNLNQQDFQLNVYYNNIETGVDIPYIPYGAINGTQLIRVLDCDKLSVNGDRFSDGVFDFLPGYTINPANGRIYFTTVEPFGSTLRSKFNQTDDFPTADKYLFQQLYDSTRVSAQQLTERNRYKIKGSYKSASGSEISLNALNIPQGAVVVTANGVRLTENTDYTVDYTLGRVKIINESILNSGAQIKVSVESNSLFNVQQKSLMGTRLDFKVNRDLTLGGSLLRFSEKPVTQKVSTGDEPVSNIIYGLDYNYKTEVPFLTRVIDRIPLINTKEMSSITTQGEYAQLIPGNASAIGKKGNSYIDDFEGSISLIDIRSPQSWFLASIPQGQPALFPESSANDDIDIGKNRARFNWYTIDPSLTRNQSGTTPSNYNKNVYSNNLYRQVLETELFPGKTPPNGQPVVLPVLDLGFYPAERGPYNLDVIPVGGKTAGVDASTGKLNNPTSRWGGITRRLETNDFQAANIEYVQFWLMDPFNEDYDASTHPDMDKNNPPSGDLYINIGNVSEDILKDGHMSYENGIPGNSSNTANLPVVETNLGVTPTLPPITNSFSSDEDDRVKQDVGYDGMDDEKERDKFKTALAALQGLSGFNSGAELNQNFLNDPSSDDYNFFRDDDYDAGDKRTLDRYRYYNNSQGNSPTQKQYQSQNSAGYSTLGSNNPNIEDVNKDNTLSETENYYQYRIKISKQDLDPNNVGNNFLVNSFDGTGDIEGIKKTVKWYQFKVPVTQFETVVGGIEGFNSIRFMRVYMKGFNKPIVLRLARFEMVRADWRRYQFDLTKPGEYLGNEDNSTSFDVSAVSVQENGQKIPVNYVIPPGIQQQQNIQTTNLVLQNEQSLQLRTTNLKDGDSRAVYRNLEQDMRMFKHIKMFVHGEKLGTNPLKDGDLTVFIRLGTDYNNNYYEYEIPLQLTNPGYYDPNNENDKGIVWPSANEINIAFDELTSAKETRNSVTGKDLALTQKPYSISSGNNTITVVGNPNLGGVKSIMIGIRNPKDNDALPHSAEVWVNELRLTDFNNKGGWATTGRVQAKLADLGQVSLAGTYSKPFFGSVEKKINERNKETTLNWDFTSQFQIGKFFPAKWKVSLPVYYSYGETRVKPLFNPYEPDVALDNLKSNEHFTNEDIKKLKFNALDYTKRKGVNFTNVRVDGLKRAGAKPMPWDISNFAITYAYTEQFKRNVNIHHNILKQYRANITYGFQLQPKPWKPFNKMKIFENKWFALIKDFNLQPLPNRFGVSMDVTRNYSELLNRDITSFYTNTDDRTLTQYNKQFLVARAYDFRWDLSKALKFDYTANNDGRILEPYGAIDTKEKKDTIIQNMKGFGVNTAFRQQFNINYTVPINKIPILDFITLSYRYGGTYTWNRKPFAANEQIGNTIQNTNSKNYTANLSMISLYNKIPYFKKINSGQTSNAGKKKDKAKSNLKGDTASVDEPKKENFKDIGEFIARGIMMIKTVNFVLQQTNGTGMPNFKPTSQYLGMNWGDNNAPGVPFIAGSQEDIRPYAQSQGWLTQNPNQTTPYTQTKTQTITYRTSIEPHGSLKIELNGSQNKSRNLTEFMRWDSISNDFHFHESPNETGNFSSSVFSLRKSFTDKGKGIESNLFQEFLVTRQDYARQLSEANAGYSSGLQTNGLGKPYYDGYNQTQQDVLMGAFYETYTGGKIRNYSTKNIFPGIPKPNWTITWDGLGKIKSLQKIFRSITLRHSYKSTYSIGAYSNNLLFINDKNGNTISRSPVSNPVINGTAESSNFTPYYNVASVVMSEAFAPLIKIDLQFMKPGWQGNFEIKRDKTVTLNFTGPQIIETKGQEYVIGVGYRYPKLTIKRLTIQGKPLQSDLNLKIDLSYRRNVSVIRRIVDEISTPTGGTNIITLRSAIDYQLTQNINLRLFYDWIRTTPQTSASFPTSNTNAGFSLRINLQ
jgi:cell surface protein SprA